MPTQHDVDLYFDRWQRAVDAEPILDGRYPQRYRDYNVSPTLHTTNPTIISAWTAAAPDRGAGLVRVSLTTGDPAVDDIVAQLLPIGLNAFWTDNAGTYNFTLWVGAVYNEELLETDLQPFSAYLDDPIHRPQDDGTFDWLAAGSGDEPTASIVFTFGWGDCMSGCQGFHTVRAVVPPIGMATVYDLGGDPLPPGLELSPNTLPPP